MYFVTVCTHRRRLLLWEPGTRALSSIGRIVRDEWLRTESIRAGVCLGEFVIMPDHIHGLVGCVDGTSVANVIRGFKSAVSSKWNGAGPLWQRGCYEHIVRSERALGQICEYIWANPESWPNEPPLRLEDGEAPLRDRVTDVRGRGERSDL